MKVADIKKLKVAELRSRLTELGLDSKGLKAELVGRLWSALEAGHTQEEGDEDLKLLKPPQDTPQTETICESTEAGVPPRRKVDRATQTDTETKPQQDPEFTSDCAAGERGRAFYEFKEEIRYKRAKSPQPPVDREEAEEEDEDKVRLDSYGSHLHFEVGPDYGCGQPRFWAQFPSLWSGCRLTHGVLQGKVGFEVRLEKKLLTSQLEEQENMNSYGLRVGWSTADVSLLLGEGEFSFAYDRRGKRVSGGKEEEFGEPFSEGDIIGCYASFSADGTVELSFHNNGRSMGVAFSLDASVLLGRALFPHILCKSCSVRFHLYPTTPPWFAGPAGFTPLADLSAGQRIRSTLSPTSRAQCEVLLMVGLPGSGKSHWARTHMKQHPEKQYKLLGTEELLACMISGGQRDSRLQQASQCLTDLIKMAAQIPGNYILDQSNILFSARHHKLQLFSGFRRRVVVVFPSAEEWKRRLSQHQEIDREEIPETALLKLQVSCSLPEQQSDLLEELQYVELPEEQAQTLLQEYKEQARRLLPPSPNRRKNPGRKDPILTALLSHIGASGLDFIGGTMGDLTCSNGGSSRDIGLWLIRTRAAATETLTVVMTVTGEETISEKKKKLLHYLSLQGQQTESSRVGASGKGPYMLHSMLWPLKDHQRFSI